MPQLPKSNQNSARSSWALRKPPGPPPAPLPVKNWREPPSAQELRRERLWNQWDRKHGKQWREWQRRQE